MAADDSVEPGNSIPVSPEQWNTRRAVKIYSAWIFAISLAYATLRYHFFGDVAWTDWPTYTTNKACAITALLLAVISMVRKSSAPILLLPAARFVAVHIILSVMMLSPAYYDNFFESNKLTVNAGLSMLFGALAAVGMSRQRRASNQKVLNQMDAKLSCLVLMIGAHAAWQGYKGWFTPSEWPGWLPPITLISCVLALVAFVISTRK